MSTCGMVREVCLLLVWDVKRKGCCVRYRREQFRVPVTLDDLRRHGGRRQTERPAHGFFNRRIQVCEHADRTRDLPHRNGLAGPHEWRHEDLVELLREGHETGEFRAGRPERYATRLMAMLDGLSTQVLLGASREDALAHMADRKPDAARQQTFLDALRDSEQATPAQREKWAAAARDDQHAA